MGETDVNVARGIKNTEVRYRERMEDLTTESHVYRRRKKKKRRARVDSDGQQVAYSAGAATISPKAAKELELRLKSLFDSEAINYEEGDAKLLITNRPVKPDFPFGIFFLAVVKDVLDALQLTILLALLVLVITLPILLILAFWFHNKMSGVWWKKKLLAKFWKRFAPAALIESLPLVGLIPATTILVLMAHHSETKFVQMLNGALESLRHRVT